MVPSAEGLDPRVVRSMHRLFGKGYASGGGRLRFGAKVSAVASSKFDGAGCNPAVSDSNLVTGSRSSPSLQDGVEEHVKLESLILAQNERWRQA